MDTITDFLTGNFLAFVVICVLIGCVWLWIFLNLPNTKAEAEARAIKRLLRDTEKFKKSNPNEYRNFEFLYNKVKLAYFNFEKRMLWFRWVFMFLFAFTVYFGIKTYNAYIQDDPYFANYAVLWFISAVAPIFNTLVSYLMRPQVRDYKSMVEVMV